jgi:hypothetical protein
MILPGTAYLYFSRYKFNSASFKKLVLMILLFVVVLVAIYSYLPLRASQNPLLNWGNPLDWERISTHNWQTVPGLVIQCLIQWKQFEYLGPAI